MFHSLLVPLDGTRFSEHALPLAEGIAKATGASVHLTRVHVSNPPDGLLSNTQFHYEGVDMGEYEGIRLDEERSYVKEMVQRFSREAPVPVDGIVLEGDIAHRLVDHLKVTEADAVILTTHAREGVSRAWLGSVAESLIQDTTVPVLALRWDPDDPRPEPTEVRHILVPLDGSALAESILDPAVDLAQAMGARITLVNVVRSGLRTRARFADGERYLRRAAQRLEDSGVECDILVTSSGKPADAICRVAREVEADLIAIATHGRAGVSRALLGSVALKVLHNTHLPLLVRRPALA